MGLSSSFPFLLAGIQGFSTHREGACFYSGPSFSESTVRRDLRCPPPSSYSPGALPRGPCQETAPPCPPPRPPLVPRRPHKQLLLQRGASGPHVGLTQLHGVCLALPCLGPARRLPCRPCPREQWRSHPWDLTERTANPSRGGARTTCQLLTRMDVNGV